MAAQFARGPHHMLSKLAIGIVVVLIAGLAYHQYEIGQIEDRLDELVTHLDPLGDFEYSRVRVAPGGQLHVDDVRFSPHAHPGELRAGRVTLEAENLPELLRQRRTLERERLPRAMETSIHQLQIPAAWTRANTEDPLAGFLARLDTAGCEPLADADHDRVLNRLGLARTPVDLTLGYRIDGSGDRMEFIGDYDAGDLGRLHTRLELDPRAGTRDLERLAPALLGAPMNRLAVEYRDAGYYRALQDFCRRESGLEAEAWREHHLGEWLQTWAAENLQPGPDLTRGYRTFIEDPISFAFRVGRERDPRGRARGADSPLDFLRQLDIRLTVNGERAGTLALARGDVIELPDAPDAPAAEPDARDEEPTAPEPEPRAASHIAWEDLPRHVGRYVIVIAEGEQRRPGRLLEVGEDDLQLRQRLHGGFIVIRLRRDEVHEIRAAR